MKCDEGRPSCAKCLKSGWKCGGYETNIGHESNSSTTTPSPPILAIANYSLPFRVPGSQVDRQVLHYFFVQGSHDIAGFLDSAFWSRIVPQHIHQDQVVRQALVALSSLHLDYITADIPGQAARTETLVCYNKAIRALRKRMENTSKETTRLALICCVLFYCFEITLGNDEAALRHLNSGLKLLPAYHQEANQAHNEDIVEMSAVFERLDLQATHFDDSRVPQLKLAPKNMGDILPNDLSGYEFSRLEDARRALVRLQNWLMHFLISNLCFKDQPLESIPLNVLHEKDLLMRESRKWTNGFEALRLKMTQDQEHRCAIYALEIQYIAFTMLLQSNHPTDISVFGASPNPAAERAIELAEYILEHTGERNASAETAKNPRRNFSSETGIVAPLFLLAMKCADESVCGRAAKLLAASRRREGLYDGQTMAQIVDKLNMARKQASGDEVDCILKAKEGSALEHWIPEDVDTAEGGFDRLI